jgi:hypothetical protein
MEVTMVAKMFQQDSLRHKTTLEAFLDFHGIMLLEFNPAIHYVPVRN